MTMQSSRSELEFILRRDLMGFIVRSFYELNPQTKFFESPHIEVMASRLEACRQRKIKRLIVNMPPRALKSHAVSVAFVAWLLGHDPTRQIICASYGQELADKHARDCRTLMASSFFRRLFPRTRLSPDKQAVNDFMTTEQGFRMSTSVTGVLTGRGADVIILDDPLKPEEALSETRRNSVNDWYSNTLLSRLNNKETGVIIIVMQRLHQDDLVGHVMEQGNWDVLSFPAIAEEDETHIIESPWGKRIFQRKAGEVLQPERESKFTLDTIRKNTGEYDFSSQYQQSPMPLGGAIIKTQWLRYYDLGKLPERFTSVLQSWDTANKSGDLNDFSVCTTWGVASGFYYLLHVFRQRLNYPDLKRAVQDQARREHAYLHPANTILIEDKASGTQLIQDLQAEGVLHVTPYDPPPGSDKLIRLYSQSAEFENGRVLLPSSASWLDEYIRELTAFPGSKYDDQVDSTSQALEHMKQNRGLAIWEKLGMG
jgi:predicted phage terminase large subunit-like protein